MSDAANKQINSIAIAELIMRERAARDAGRWEEMADCYHNNSEVEVSWFRGSGRDFVAGSQKLARGPVYTFHVMSPAVVTIRNNRALATTNCTVHGITSIDGCEVDITSHAQILWRAQRDGARWLIAGLHIYYIKDSIVPLNPSNAPMIDPRDYEKGRPSYRSIAFVMARGGHTIPDNLPGVDQPDTVTALRVAEQAWLEQPDVPAAAPAVASANDGSTHARAHHG